MPADGGIKFGQYVLLRRIARGGMAEVFLAQQRGLEGFDRRVAVKRILPHLADTPDFVKMFLGEARLAAQLSHPNIVHIYDFGKVDTDYFIAMEYVEGVHAGQLLKQSERERLSPTLIARLGADAASALHHAHGLTAANGSALGLVHRDVSPANIMVSYDGIVKLCDFGIAKATSATANLTNPGQVKGKYAYMSPEQTIAGALDGRSDVFSLGIVLWELVTGKTIVGRGDAIEAMRAIRDGKLPTLAQAAPQTPPALAKAINWALETRREKRATAIDLAQALEAFIKSSPEIATPMQLAAFVRSRYPRETSGAQPMQTPGGSMSPGTMAAPGTGIEVSEEIPAAKIPTGASPKPQAPMKLRETKPTQPPPINTTPTVALSMSSIYESGIEGERDTPQDNDAFDSQETMSLDGPGMGKRLRITERAGAVAFEPRSDAITIDPDIPSPLAKAIANSRYEDGDRTTTSPPPAFPTTARGPTGPSTITGAPPPGPRAVPRPSATPPTGVPPMGSGPRQNPHTAAADEPTRLDSLDLDETLMRSGPRPAPLPNPGALPTRSTQQVAPGYGYAASTDGTAGMRKRLPRQVVVGLALGGLALLSFIIAASAKSCSGPTVPVVAVQPPIVTSIDAAAPSKPDAAAIVAVAPDAAPPDAPAPDAEPTIRPEALTLLEVRTRPDGAAITIGDQTRISPAKFALPAGKHTIVAELAGYEPERREVELLATEHFSSEIAFMTRLPAGSGGSAHVSHDLTGHLTLRTTPYSEVYANGKKIGEAPFADLPMAAGTYRLEMKNPTHPTLIKTITIYAGKPAKFNWDLPL